MFSSLPLWENIDLETAVDNPAEVVSLPQAEKIREHREERANLLTVPGDSSRSSPASSGRPAHPSALSAYGRRVPTEPGIVDFGVPVAERDRIRLIARKRQIACSCSANLGASVASREMKPGARTLDGDRAWCETAKSEYRPIWRCRLPGRAYGRSPTDGACRSTGNCAVRWARSRGGETATRTGLRIHLRAPAVAHRVVEVAGEFDEERTVIPMTALSGANTPLAKSLGEKGDTAEAKRTRMGRKPQPGEVSGDPVAPPGYFRQLPASMGSVTPVT